LAAPPPLGSRVAMAADPGDRGVNMAGARTRRVLKMAVAVAVGTMVSTAHGQVYKCTDGAGKTTYSDVPCASGSKPLKLPDDAQGKGTNPQVCAQLLDETRRLAAEAERDAKRGRAESAHSLKRRQALTRQYENRCVGIARSEPSQK
jgi:hypothetical protein